MGGKGDERDVVQGMRGEALGVMDQGGLRMKSVLNILGIVLKLCKFLLCFSFFFSAHIFLVTTHRDRKVYFYFLLLFIKETIDCVAKG